MIALGSPWIIIYFVAAAAASLGLGGAHHGLDRGVQGRVGVRRVKRVGELGGEADVGFDVVPAEAVIFVAVVHVAVEHDVVREKVGREMDSLEKLWVPGLCRFTVDSGEVVKVSRW
ncbi:hypothetical protein FF2_006151 [Malus domestica]